MCVLSDDGRLKRFSQTGLAGISIRPSKVDSPNMTTRLGEFTLAAHLLLDVLTLVVLVDGVAMRRVEVHPHRHVVRPGGSRVPHIRSGAVWCVRELGGEVGATYSTDASASASAGISSSSATSTSSAMTGTSDAVNARLTLDDLPRRGRAREGHVGRKAGVGGVRVAVEEGGLVAGRRGRERGG